ncbi:Thiol:disulfide interchange protein DsbB [Kushneria avicenniae]|uniref:Disulfide bond formation protein B n=1 Tax=Kushneria avicenniae TaxID=402385 RepID=A0A1I1IGE0_9GAMM|nr:disulfide bond formation protein B [Kushneria avicenniae]SFC33298.1 Thiol:disulfide interchange protein DsbB [Kushneria avicenniae]
MSKLLNRSARQWCLAGSAFCIFMLAFALVLQYGFGLEPCPLCTFQRVAVLVALVPLIVGALHNPRGWAGSLYGVLSLIGAGAGIFLAGRHVWLQNLPADQVPSCGPGLNYMMEVLPLQSVIAMVLNSSGECAEVKGSFLGVSLPGWTLLGFVVLALITIGLIAGAIRRQRLIASA